MMDLRKLRGVILQGMAYYVNTGLVPPEDIAPGETGESPAMRPCKIVRRNQTKNEIPPYPYIAYTITSAMLNDKRQYSEHPEHGRLYKPVGQMWSFTAQSDDADEAAFVALRAHNFMSAAGRIYLDDRGIVVRDVGNVNNRPALLTVEYEHRDGFDVELAIVNELPQTHADISGWIETVELPNMKHGG